MEEVQTTEVLDREILEDARKKAHKILKSSSETLENQTREWEVKIQKSLESIRNVYIERAGKTEAEITARLPLDKRRIRSEIMQKYLAEAMDNFLSSLSREKLLSILTKELSQRLAFYAEEVAARTGSSALPRTLAPEIFYSGLSLSEAEGVLEKTLNGIKTGNRDIWPGEKKDWRFKEDSHPYEFPYMAVNTQAVKITASVETAAASMMNEKRAELAGALLGTGALDD